MTCPPDARALFVFSLLIFLLSPAYAQNEKQVLTQKNNVAKKHSHETAPATPNLGRFSQSASPISRIRLNALSNLQRGKFDEASLAFEEIHTALPNDTETLLMLAALAELRNRPVEADNWRQRAYHIAPLSTDVLAAMLGASSNRLHAPLETESQLRSLLSRHPESAPLHFALGNLELSRGQWLEAKAAFVAALSNDGDNPDYLFNLAITLDHLRQHALAAKRYRDATHAAELRPSVMNKDEALRRQREIEEMMK